MGHLHDAVQVHGVSVEVDVDGLAGGLDHSVEASHATDGDGTGAARALVVEGLVVAVGDPDDRVHGDGVTITSDPADAHSTAIGQLEIASDLAMLGLIVLRREFALDHDVDDTAQVHQRGVLAHGLDRSSLGLETGEDAGDVVAVGSELLDRGLDATLEAGHGELKLRFTLELVEEDGGRTSGIATELSTTHLEVVVRRNQETDLFHVVSTGLIQQTSTALSVLDTTQTVLEHLDCGGITASGGNDESVVFHETFLLNR